MTEPNDARILSFLHGTLGEPERTRLLDEMDSNPELSRDVRAAARGMMWLTDSELTLVPGANTSPVRAGDTGADSAGQTRARSNVRISPWWAVAASLATLMISVPLARTLAPGTDPSDGPTTPADFVVDEAIPNEPDPSFLLVLHGRWDDAATVEATTAGARRQEYWNWTRSLAERGVLVAAGDLRWEAGARLTPGGSAVQLAASTVEADDFLVGVFALRADTYEEAMEIARQCPHLAYGGTVSVRQVGGGFVTVPGAGDWTP